MVSAPGMPCRRTLHLDIVGSLVPIHSMLRQPHHLSHSDGNHLVRGVVDAFGGLEFIQVCRLELRNICHHNVVIRSSTSFFLDKFVSDLGHELVKGDVFGIVNFNFIEVAAISGWLVVFDLRVSILRFFFDGCLHVG